MKRHHKRCQRAAARRVTELERLRRRNAVMETLCGFVGSSQNVIDSAVSIQAAVRGWILRCDKRIFDRCVSNFLNRCRVVVQRRRFKRARQSALIIQRNVRGFTSRRSSTGRAIQKLLKYKRDAALLERLTLKLASFVYTDGPVLETTQITIE